MIVIAILVDYRPVYDESYTLHLVIAGRASEAASLHDRFASSIDQNRTAVLRDAEGEVWSFAPGTVRAFWTRPL